MSIRKYIGSKKKCDGCGRVFQDSDYILACRNMIFCHQTGSAGLDCLGKKLKGQGLKIETMLFREKLPGYGGVMESCNYCHKDFVYGDKVLVNMQNSLLFCAEKDGVHTCVANYFGKKTKGNIIIPQGKPDLERRRFHGNT